MLVEIVEPSKKEATEAEKAQDNPCLDGAQDPRIWARRLDGKGIEKSISSLRLEKLAELKQDATHPKDRLTLLLIEETLKQRE